MDERERSLIERIVDEWKAAERVIKLAEQSSGEIFLPAIAELRYAGRRVVEFLAVDLRQAKDVAQSKALLQDALHNVMRAKHDAVDAMVAKADRDLRHAVAERGVDAIPDFSIDFKVMKRVKAKIAESRAERSSRNDVYVSILDEDIRQVFEIVEKYSYLAPVDNSRQPQSSFFRDFSRRENAAYIAIGSIVSAILGLLVALLGI